MKAFQHFQKCKYMFQFLHIMFCLISEIYLANTLELSPSSEAASHLATQKFSQQIMEPGGSLPCSQEPSAGP
jgi:hypothetical protein